MSVILEARDEGNTGLPFGCLLTQIILQSGINITGTEDEDSAAHQQADFDEV